MAWNPSPTVAAARDIGKKFNRDQVILLMIDEDGQLELATYGKTVTLCRLTGMLGDIAFDAVLGEMKKLIANDQAHPVTHLPHSEKLSDPAHET